jgi:hypothetical protein
MCAKFFSLNLAKASELNPVLPMTGCNNVLAGCLPSLEHICWVMIWNAGGMMVVREES